MIKNILLLAVSVLSLASCSNGNASSEAEPVAQTADSLVKVRPQDLKNAVELISDDWMLLAAGQEGDFNEMTIAWGQLGELWGRPVMTVFVDTLRFTHQFLDKNDYFTVSGFPVAYKDDLQYLGTHSGRDGDKLSETGLHALFTQLGNPYFAEANVVIECKKIYANEFDTSKMIGDMSDFYAKRGSIHTVYIGEIVNVWKK